MSVDISLNIGKDNHTEYKSFSILRTNPKLTTNVSLVVDSIDSIFLKSISANKELSGVEYQKYPLLNSGLYQDDVSKFYGRLQQSFRYDVLRKGSDSIVSGEYKDQYENQYNYGASFNSTKLYNEQYKIFAPIWLEEKVPDNFVIYRVDGVDFDEGISTQPDKINEMLKHSTIIKTFDLTEKSNAGKYLNNYIKSQGFPKAPLYVNFSDDSPILYNGIDINKGGFVSREEFISSEFTGKDNLEISSNELITNGFERNGVAVANIINMEFMFDDNNAESYKVYRYFGLYTDSIDEGTTKLIDISKKGIISADIDDVDLIWYKNQPNIHNVLDIVDDSSNLIPNESDFALPVLGYVKDKFGTYYNIKNGIQFKSPNIPISLNNSVLSNFNGKEASGAVLNIVNRDTELRGIIEVELTESPNTLDQFYLAPLNELKEIESCNFGDFIYVADSTLDPGTYSDNNYSNKGTLEQILHAISGVISNGATVQYKSDVIGTKLVIHDYSLSGRSILGLNDNNFSNFFSISTSSPLTQQTCIANWTEYLTSGILPKKYGFTVNKTDIGSVKVGQYIKDKQSERFAKITEIIYDLTNDAYRIILNSKIELPSDNVVDVYNDYRLTFGKFSAYDFKDFNYDFYDTSYSDLGELKYKQTGDDTYSTDTDVKYYTLEGDISSEYDRLEENKLKETSINSRVVPIINKFALRNGTNARNMPYILNANLSFGIDNVSPNIGAYNNRDPKYLNLEHFHIHDIPKFLRDSNISHDDATGFKSYLNKFSDDSGVVLDVKLDNNTLSSISTDYFSQFFNYNGYWKTDQDRWVNDIPFKQYTEFSNNINVDSNTVFRGLRYTYKQRKERTSKKPSDFTNKYDINGYKFGSYISYINSADSNKVDIEVIKNDKFKFIVIHIKISIIENDVVSLDRDKLYNLTDIELGSVIQNTSIDGGLDWSSVPDWNASNITINASGQFGGIERFRDQIYKLSDGDYSYIEFKQTISGVLTTYRCKVLSVVDDNTLIISGKPLYYDGVAYGAAHGSPESIPFNTLISYADGGKGGWSSIINSITSKEIADRFENNTNITYKTYGENTSGDLITTDNEFILAIDSGTSIKRPFQLIHETDPDRPQSYRLFSGEIGKIISNNNSNLGVELMRMDGEYTPLFKDVLTFADLYREWNMGIIETDGVGEPDELTIEEKRKAYRESQLYYGLNGLGVAFSSYLNIHDDYGIIQNLFFHKVNDENKDSVLKVDGTSKEPLYPLIGEIAIDKKDLNMLDSKYSANYFTKSYSAGVDNESVYGTLSPVENKSFFASTIMKVEDSYDLTKYTTTKESSYYTLEYIKTTGQNKTAVHYIEDENRIIADFYLDKSLNEKLREYGIAEIYASYVNAKYSFDDKESIEDDVNEYITNNIIPRFIIDNIEVYSKSGKSIGSEITSVNSKDNLKADGYDVGSGFEIRVFSSSSFGFRLIYNKKHNINHKIKVLVQINA